MGFFHNLEQINQEEDYLPFINKQDLIRNNTRFKILSIRQVEEETGKEQWHVTIELDMTPEEEHPFSGVITFSTKTAKRNRQMIAAIEEIKRHGSITNCCVNERTYLKNGDQQRYQELGDWKDGSH